MNSLDRVSPANTLVLRLTDEIVIPNNIEKYARENNLNIKSEHHITIIGTQTAKIISEHTEYLEKIFSLANTINWHYALKQEYNLISKNYFENTSLETRTSIIQIVETPGLEDFYSQVSTMIGVHLEIPFAHITLFTTSTNQDNKERGIGLYSYADFLLSNPQLLNV